MLIAKWIENEGLNRKGYIALLQRKVAEEDERSTNVMHVHICL